MGKKNKNNQAGDAGDVAGVTQKLTNLSVGPTSKELSLFPPKPQRKPGQIPPGRTVKLIVNLFGLSIEQQKPIYRYSVQITIEDDNDDGKPSEAEGKKKPTQRKLGRDIRRQVVDAAFKQLLSDKTKISSYTGYDQKLSYNYVYDAAGAFVFALFNLFGVKKPGQKLLVDVIVPLEKIVGDKLVNVPTKFAVMISSIDSPLSFATLIQYCQGTRSTDITAIQEELRVVNVLTRAKISSVPGTLLTAVNVYNFNEKNETPVGQRGVYIKPGYYMSARAIEGQVVINVANTVSAFHQPLVLTDMLKNIFRVSDFAKGLRPDIIEKMRSDLKTKQIEVTSRNYGTQQRPHYRKYRISDIGGNSNQTFMIEDSTTKKKREISIKQYYKETYGVDLKYPQLPCIIDKERKIPLELCRLVDKQRVARKMDPQETSQIITQTAVAPLEHFKKVQKYANEVKAMSQPLSDFGLKFDTKPIEVEGRELPPVNVMGGARKPTATRDGQYDLRRERFFRPAKVTKWTVAFLADVNMKRDRERDEFLFARKFSGLYSDAARAKGMDIAAMQRPFILDPQGDPRAYLKKMFVEWNQNGYDHIIIVLPKVCPDWIYRYIQYLEVTASGNRKPGERWTRTSCIKYENYIKKIVDSRDNGIMFIANLLLKHNTKLGGQNIALCNNTAHLEILKTEVLFVSVDVCHPAPGDRLIQSVAAVMGMWDVCNNMSQCTRIRVQTKQREDHSTVEDVVEIGTMIGEILDEYKLKKKTLPKKIVILRDGVSEGQFKIVLEKEIWRVKQTLAKSYKGMPAPELTCLVVQKRHRVRFMRKEPIQGKFGPDHQIAPATVVDHGVDHPTDHVFYIAPHKAIKGTARAPRIYMIVDENKFSQDQAQAMIHALSYLSPRCNKGTAIPTPVNLADLAAERGKNIVISWQEDNTNVKTESEKLTALNRLLCNLAETGYKNTLYYI